MKYYGKEKCRILKEIRAEIAKANDIEWVVSECKHQGNCKGTCPKCEQEVRELEAALARREALGKTVAVVGISASIALSVTGCINPFPQTTAGVPMSPGETTAPETTAEETYQPCPGMDTIPSETTAEETDIPIPGEPVLPETEALAGAPAWEGEYVEEAETTDEETVTSTEPETFEAIMGDMPVE